jgi:hypothetical protein
MQPAEVAGIEPFVINIGICLRRSGEKKVALWSLGGEFVVCVELLIACERNILRSFLEFAPYLGLQCR